jgi:predicted transcriptional regulator
VACINPDGTLTLVAQAVLTALEPPRSAEEASAKAGYPLYRVRATLRETLAAQLIEETAGRYGLTDKGREVLELSAEE